MTYDRFFYIHHHFQCIGSGYEGRYRASETHSITSVRVLMGGELLGFIDIPSFVIVIGGMSCATVGSIETGMSLVQHNRCLCLGKMYYRE